MREFRPRYTWRLSVAELAKLDVAERRAVDSIVLIESEIRSYLTACIPDPDDRIEALANALAAAWLLADVDSKIDSLRSRALDVARIESAQWKARQRHREATGLDLESLRLDSGPESEGPPEEWAWLELALTTLRREERIALELWATEGASNDKVANVLGCKPATVRKLRQRAKLRLRELARTIAAKP